MLKINADLQFKDSVIRTKDCVVEKIIELTGEQFDLFSKGLLKDQGFIKENNHLMRFGEDGAYHCLLVTGEGRDDGILIQSEGSDYARYSSHIPHVHSVIAMDRYPALGNLCRKMTEMADYIVAEGVKPDPGEDRAFVSMDDLEEMSGIDVAYNNSIVTTLMEMVAERPEVADLEIVKSEFVITPAAPDLEQSPEQEQAQEPGQTMNM